MKRFFVVLFVIAFLIAGVSLWLVFAGIIPALPSFFYPSLLLLAFGTGLIYVYLYKVNASSFVMLYLLTIVLKLLAYIAYMLIIILKDRSGAFSNVVFFMIVYFIFTVLEIVFLYRKINGQKHL